MSTTSLTHWQYRLFRKSDIHLRSLVARYDDEQGCIVEEHNGEVEGRAVMVRRSAGYSDFSVGNYLPYVLLISVPQLPRPEIATISEVRQENMVLMCALNNCFLLLTLFHRDHRVEQLFGYSRAEGSAIFAVYHGGKLFVNC
jgi:hypothetical protein